MVKKFGDYTEDQYANSLAHHVPSGYFWKAKWHENTNLRNLLLGLGIELMRLDDKYNEFFSDYVDIENTTNLIEEWEKQVGIPDGCITVANNLEDRRTNVLLKLVAIGAQTDQDWIDIAALLGITITIQNLNDVSTWPWTWPHTWGGTQIENRFTIVVTFVGVTSPSVWPWTWPHTWTVDVTDVLECLFNQLKPATKSITFRYE